MDQKSVRWRPGSLDTCIDEPEYLPFGAAAATGTWPEQLALSSSSSQAFASPCQCLPLRVVAPLWDSPPLSPSSQQPSTNHRGDDPVAAHSIPSLTAITPSWDSPTSLPAHTAHSPMPVSFVASPPHTTTQPPTKDHPNMDEEPDAELTANSHFAALQQFTDDLGIQVTKARWLAILLSGPASEHPALLNTATDGPIVATYNHYSNILVKSSIRFWLLLARGEQVMQTQQYIEDLMTKDWDGEDEVEIDEDLL
ncbi:hypothetical protein F5J12DRAFT_787725 [Pisolithus orientalis]|uniref:uncharacterized protein n=1 Tax=Pisolithus orientalis TaxID=936130 RepID=UPI00222411C9|nr:uncharacterized protein F5J12DRAFT_787725 [Pisolithus orientalis]KAI5983736.1 hypothetical protein F5J12DRAFT_787725 [Pisolithus orientalis]